MRRRTIGAVTIGVLLVGLIFVGHADASGTKTASSSGHNGTQLVKPELASASQVSPSDVSNAILPGLSATRAELDPTDLDSIEVTLNRYALGTDSANADMLASTFTTNAVFLAMYPDQSPFLDFQGREAIIDYLIPAREALNYSERHLITNVSAERIGRGEALVHAYFLVTRLESDGTVGDSSMGIYNMEMVREENGVWLIKINNVVLDTSLH